MQAVPYQLTERALRKFGDLFTKYLKEEIQKKQFPYGHPQKGMGDKVATGKLLDSISYDVEIDSNGEPQMSLYYIDYFKYVNEGRRPNRKKVPISSILDWIKVRGLQGRNKKGRFIPRLSFAFAIQQSIFKYGIRPSGIYDKGLDGLLNMIDNPPPELMDEWNDVFEAMANDVNIFIEKTINIELPSKIE